MKDIDEFLLKPVIRKSSKLSEATIWREQRAGRFPPFEKISERRVGLRRSVYEEWLDGRRDWAGETA